MPELFLGVDGGGTRTRAALVTEDGTLLGMSEGAASNVDLNDDAALEATLASVLTAAFEAAELPPSPPRATMLGVAGVTGDRDRDRVRQAATSAGFGRHIAVDHDGAAAVAGAHEGRAGLVLIAGTGSACYGSDGAGRSWRTGGWGYLIGDEGSATWLGVEGLRAVARAIDGRGAETVLQASLLGFLGIDDPDALLHTLYVDRDAREAAAAAAPLVLDAAESGDPVARALVERGARDLFDMVLACARALDLPASTPLALIGGAVASGGPLAAAVRGLIEGGRVTRIVTPSLPPVLGAALLALQQMGPLSDTVRQRLRDGATTHTAILAR